MDSRCISVIEPEALGSVPSTEKEIGGLILRVYNQKGKSRSQHLPSKSACSVAQQAWGRRCWIFFFKLACKAVEFIGAVVLLVCFVCLLLFFID